MQTEQEDPERGKKKKKKPKEQTLKDASGANN